MLKAGTQHNAFLNQSCLLLVGAALTAKHLYFKHICKEDIDKLETDIRQAMLAGEAQSNAQASTVSLFTSKSRISSLPANNVRHELSKDCKERIRAAACLTSAIKLCCSQQVVQHTRWAVAG